MTPVENATFAENPELGSEAKADEKPDLVPEQPVGMRPIGGFVGILTIGPYHAVAVRLRLLVPPRHYVP